MVRIVLKRVSSMLIVSGLITIAVYTPTSAAESTSSIYAQQLVRQFAELNPDLRDVIFHVMPPGSPDNSAIASLSLTERGLKSGDDDIGVMTTGKPLVEIQKDGVRIGVLVPLKDQRQRTIGALGLMYPYRTGENQQKFLQRSFAIRDQIAKRIVSRESLFDRAS